MGMNTRRWTVLAVLTLLGLAGCYESGRGCLGLFDAHSGDAADTPIDQDADATMEADADLDCILWSSRVFVDYVQSVSLPVEGFVTVTLRGGQQLQLDVLNSLGEFWDELLDSYRERHRPIYLEVDDARTMTIIDLLMPLESQVQAISPDTDGVFVELAHSHAIQFLNRSHPCYEQLLTAIETAQRQGSVVLVCTDYNDGNKILDARPLPAP